MEKQKTNLNLRGEVCIAQQGEVGEVQPSFKECFKHSLQFTYTDLESEAV